MTPVILLGLPQRVVVYANDGSGGLDDRSHFQTNFSGFSWCATVADFTGDGLPEIAAGMAIPGSIMVLENRTDPDGPIDFAAAVPIHEGAFIRSLASGDVDRDGRIDLLAADIASDVLLIFRNRTGEGGLAGMDDAPGVATGDVGLGSDPVRGAPSPMRPLADRNRDGRLDGRDLAIELAEFGTRSAPRWGEATDAEGDRR